MSKVFQAFSAPPFTFQLLFLRQVLHMALQVSMIIGIIKPMLDQSFRDLKNLDVEFHSVDLFLVMILREREFHLLQVLANEVVESDSLPNNPFYSFHISFIKNFRTSDSLHHCSPYSKFI